ncbi:MAG TPA: CapA family protein [Thermodesulfobacteriota bacterium]|nr:CapA family protein [Thermodesulfobacteriota bacterium]
MNPTDQGSAQPAKRVDLITLFLCGDVMTGRGIDQILPHPSDPAIHEPYMKDARGYVEIAERVNGPVPRSVAPGYIWGDALEELERKALDLRIINLETSVTKSDDYWEGKQIHYRMHPENIDCITEAKIDVCSLANNHVLDWGYAGLEETLETLRKRGIRGIGAGKNLMEAEAPAIVEVAGKGRVIAFAFGSPTSGVFLNWTALEKRPGINLLEDFSDNTIQGIRKKVRELKHEHDIVVVSIHWGGNWGYHVPQKEIDFAHLLIEEAGADMIHGHSSHHVKGIEVYQEKLILYGCGDFLNDYEGIGGYEHYRSDLGLMYFATLDPLSGKLVQLRMTPTQIRYFKVNRASRDDSLWLARTLNREGRRFGTRVRLDQDNRLTLFWDQSRNETTNTKR